MGVLHPMPVRYIPCPHKLAIKNDEIAYQLVPPGDHWRNIAERGIQIAKGHTISVLCGADPKFSMHLWDRLLRGWNIVVMEISRCLLPAEKPLSIS